MKNTMIRIALLLCFAAVVSFALTGCGQSPSSQTSSTAQPSSTGWWENYIDLKTATETYSIKDAKAADYVIIVDNQITAGEQIWKDFVRHTQLGMPSRIRIVHSDSLARIASSYAVPDVHSYITEVEYDGEKYISRSYCEGELYQSEYTDML